MGVWLKQRSTPLVVTAGPSVDETGSSPTLVLRQLRSAGVTVGMSVSDRRIGQLPADTRTVVGLAVAVPADTVGGSDTVGGVVVTPAAGDIGDVVVAGDAPEARELPLPRPRTKPAATSTAAMTINAPKTLGRDRHGREVLMSRGTGQRKLATSPDAEPINTHAPRTAPS